PLPRRSHARTFSRRLLKMRRPWRIPEAARLVPLRHLEQLLERSGKSIHRRMWISAFFELVRNREHSEVGGIAIRNLVPVERHRNPRIGKWPHGIRATGRSILRVLVVVEEHSVPFLLPPLGSCKLRRTAFDLTRQRERGAAQIRERPPRL